jgi:hypothetical protein
MPLRNEDVIRNVITYEAATFENWAEGQPKSDKFPFIYKTDEIKTSEHADTLTDSTKLTEIIVSSAGHHKPLSRRGNKSSGSC